MSNCLRHRGPDAGGTWLDADKGVGLAHRRLAIVDLSEAGAQPIQSKDGRYFLTYNGEIYNHLDIREQLLEDGYRIPWRGHSDTETLVESLSAWGVHKALNALNGMFAFGLWDSGEQKLILGRDRFGEKPLYYGYSSGNFVFGSELKIFDEVSAFDLTIDRNSIEYLLKYSYIPSPLSIFEEVKKLRPGHWLELQKTSHDFPALQTREYWSATSTATSILEARLPNEISDEEAVEKLKNTLGSSIERQLMGDVPVGAFLSGGIDSSLVVALMQEKSSQPVNSFTIGFEESEFDEAPFAKAVANQLGTNHTEYYVSPEDALKVVPELPNIYDEPFADSSQIPTLLLSRLARTRVTVSLSGDAGDELFGGYTRYSQVAAWWRRLQHLPPEVRKFASELILRFGPGLLDKGVSRILNITSLSRKMEKTSAVLSARDSLEMFNMLVSTGDSGLLRREDGKGQTRQTLPVVSTWPFEDTVELQMMMTDTETYLPNDILVKVDRAAMAVSLETRMPFLDPQVFEFAWSLPLRMKIRDGKGKWVLRELLDRYVEKDLIERPKAGFAVPLEKWLRGPLREWAGDLLDSVKIEEAGFLDSERIQTLWDDHLTSRRNRHYQLWNILMFQAWLEKRIGYRAVCDGASSGV